MSRAKKKAAAAAAVDDLVIAKLASSGLTWDDALANKMEFIEDASQLHPSFKPLKSLVLRYIDPDGIDSGFYRVRYLETEGGFSAQLAKPQRYAQEPGSLNRVYLPHPIDWVAVASDKTVPIIFTEGELKAACAAKQGHVCMGLGGVTTYQAKKRNVALLPPLEGFEWRGRTVYIIFDSDAADNEMVAMAQLALAKKLLELGSTPQVCTLPPASDGSKQGLDDFLVSGGALPDILLDGHGLEYADRLVNFNNRFAVVMDQETIIDISSGGRMKRDTFTNLTMVNQKVSEFIPTQQGMKKIIHKMPVEWLGWANRKNVTSIVYEPGKEKITPENAYNLWKGWGVEPSSGDVTPWLWLLDYILDGMNEEERKWFIQWCAYPFQHPGAKLYSSVVLWGEETGTGKSLIGYTLGKIYGQNFTEIGNSELHANFNEWAVGKQFVMGDEITGSDKRHEADKLKALITQQRLRINMKHLPTYEVVDRINYYFTSNHPDAFFIDDKDRRFFIWRVLVGKAPREKYQIYDKWYKSKEGQAALFDWLLKVDLTGFDPASPAPVTSAKAEMVSHGQSELGAFVSHLRENMDIELARLAELLGLSEKPDLVLNTHLRMLYDPENNKRVTPNGLGRELARAGIRSLPPIDTSAFGKQRMYAVRNQIVWFNKNPDAVKEYVDRVYGKSAVMEKRRKMQ